MNTNYCERAGLRVATELAQLIEQDVAPAVGLDTARFWTGFAALLDQLVPVNQALLARRDQLQLDIDDWQRARRGQPFDVAAHEAHLVRSGYLVSGRAGLSHRHAERRRRDCPARGPAIGRAAQQCALFAQRRECPLGQSLRCFLRYRCHRGDRKSGARRRLQRDARARGDRARARGAGSSRAARVRQSPGCNRLFGVRRRAAGDAEQWQPCGAGPAGSSSRDTSGRRRRPTALLFEHHGLHIEVRIDRAHPNRPRRPGWNCGRAARVRVDHDHGSRRFDRGGRRCRQGGGVSQLAGPDARRSDGAVREGQRSCRSQAQCRSHLSDRRRAARSGFPAAA